MFKVSLDQSQGSIGWRRDQSLWAGPQRMTKMVAADGERLFKSSLASTGNKWDVSFKTNKRIISILSLHQTASLSSSFPILWDAVCRRPTGVLHTCLYCLFSTLLTHSPSKGTNKQKSLFHKEKMKI